MTIDYWSSPWPFSHCAGGINVIIELRTYFFKTPNSHGRIVVGYTKFLSCQHVNVIVAIKYFTDLCQLFRLHQYVWIHLPFLLLG